MTRECSGCGEKYCEGQCFDESPQHEIEEGEVTWRELLERHGSQLTETHGDPFLNRKRAA